MTALLRTWATALATSWPEVLAWYLGGTIVREGILSLAAPIGPDSALAAFLLLPIAVLARLVSYVGMFLAVRRSLPAFAATAAEGASGRRGRFTGFLDVLLAAIVPFFVLYGLLGLLQEDFASYANRAFRYSFGGGDFLSPGDGPLVVLVIVVALAGRIVLKRFGSRLPRGAALVEIYLEATWVFVAVSGLSAVFSGVLTWVQDRQIVRWFLDVRQGLRDVWEPIRLTIDGIDGLVPVLLQLLALPLAWLLIAGIVYTRELASVAEERVLSARWEAHLRARAQRLPAFVSRQSHLVTDEWDDVYKPLSVSARLIARMGLGGVVGYVGFYALVAAAGQWAVWSLTRLIGPHPADWWIVAFPVVATAVAAVAETLRITLVSAAFDRALAAWRTRRGAAVTGAPGMTAADSAAPGATALTPALAPAQTQRRREAAAPREAGPTPSA